MESTTPRLDAARSLEVDCPLGVRAAPLRREEAVGAILDAVRADQRIIIGNHNLHSAYLAAAPGSSRVFDEFVAASALTFADGLPITLCTWLASPRTARRRPWYRVGALDWLPYVLQGLDDSRARVFYLGGTQENLDRALARLRARYPNIALDGHHGYFTDAEVQKVLKLARRAEPDLLLVGLGMPRQERFILEHLDDLPAATIMNVGALFDYVGGAQAAPPRWLGPLGLEWLFRLVKQPRRLSRRYLWEPLALLGYLLGGRLRTPKEPRGTNDTP